MDDPLGAIDKPTVLAELRSDVSRLGLSDRGVGRSRQDTNSATTSIAVLLVGDDERTVVRTVMGLSGRGFDVRVAAKIEEAPLRIRADWAPDAIVLDLSLPALETSAIGRALRSTYAVPVIVVAKPGDERLLGMDLAEHCLHRPFTTDEVSARIRGALRRGSAAHEALVAGDLVVASGTRRALLAGRPLALSDDEFALLGRLIADTGRVVGRAALRDALPGVNRDVDSRVVDCYLVRLMVKLSGSTSLRLVRAADRDGYALLLGPFGEPSTLSTPYA
jgi:DNA-binding response OmpR family regulator